MTKCALRIVAFAVLVTFLSSSCISGIVAAAQEETIEGFVIKRGKHFVIEADDGDYIVVNGTAVSKLVNRLIEVRGIITGSDKGDLIDVKSIIDLQDADPD